MWLTLTSITPSRTGTMKLWFGTGGIVGLKASSIGENDVETCNLYALTEHGITKVLEVSETSNQISNQLGIQ